MAIAADSSTGSGGAAATPVSLYLATEGYFNESFSSIFVYSIFYLLLVYVFFVFLALFSSFSI